MHKIKYNLHKSHSVRSKLHFISILQKFLKISVIRIHKFHPDTLIVIHYKTLSIALNMEYQRKIYLFFSHKSREIDFLSHKLCLTD